MYIPVEPLIAAFGAAASPRSLEEELALAEFVEVDRPLFEVGLGLSSMQDLQDLRPLQPFAVGL